MIEPLESLSGALPVIRYHHERPDGRGYPDGLEGDVIPLAARIVAAVDAYDVMLRGRPYWPNCYRARSSPAEALKELWRGAGRQFVTVNSLVFSLEACAVAFAFGRVDLLRKLLPRTPVNKGKREGLELRYSRPSRRAPTLVPLSWPRTWQRPPLPAVPVYPSRPRTAAHPR
jgi:hypothetical protein